MYSHEDENQKKVMYLFLIFRFKKSRFDVAHHLILALSSITRTLQRVTAPTKPAPAVYLAAYTLYSIVEEGVKLFKYTHVVSVALNLALKLLKARVRNKQAIGRLITGLGLTRTRW